MISMRLGVNCPDADIPTVDRKEDGGAQGAIGHHCGSTVGLAFDDPESGGPEGFRRLSESSQRNGARLRSGIEDMLAAVFDALKGPKRIILVGDHRRLPPIGAGRPLVDLARELRPWEGDREPPFPRVGPGYTELTVHRRQTGIGNKGRDDLLLASWFTDEAPDPGADEIWVRMALGETDGHVEVRRWQTDEDLKDQLLEALVQHVPEIETDEDERGFGVSLGGVASGSGVFFNAAWPERNRPGASERSEAWQVLTPLRGKGHGVEELNRFLHERFRKQALRFAEARRPRTPRPNGAERIIYGDKVMSTTNALCEGSSLMSTRRRNRSKPWRSFR